MNLHPTPIHARMIELANEHSQIKTLCLNEIGIKVAKEFGRPRPFTREYVRQVFNHWSKKWGKPVYDKNRVSAISANSAFRYMSGKRSDTTATRAAKKLGLGKRKSLHTSNCEAKMIQASKDWMSGKEVKELAKLWGKTFYGSNTMIARYRRKRPDLFPMRRAATVPRGSQTGFSNWKR